MSKLMMKPDLAKRREVMQRSIRLGHCICEPRRPCPCDVFTEQGICPCAGERPEPVSLQEIKLTTMVRNPGCASKIAPSDLEHVLGRLPMVNDPAVISGLAAADDAAIYRLSEKLCIVQTVDVFTPCVDNPYLFGKICAANCLSDIYATGGDPRTALSILAFPSEKLSGEIMYQMLAGAMETLGEAGVALIGGHSIKDEEIKLGFAVTGLIDPTLAAALDSPKAGDVLILTKPLGTGVLAFARQIGRDDPTGNAQAEESMASLNRAAAEAMRAAGASACTDITGFGLFGHLARMLRSRNLCAHISAPALPSFSGVLELLREEVIPGAIERNREFIAPDLEVLPDVDASYVNLGLDPQTSGGLLIAISPDGLEPLRHELEKRQVSATIIGRLVQADGKKVTLSNDFENFPFKTQTMNATDPSQPHQPGCCADLFGTAPQAPAIAEAFGAFMKAVQNPGVLDAKTKELLLFTLVVHSRCEPCFKSHYAQALELGLTQPQLEEAAWCAVAMGGAPVRMFYKEQIQKLRA